MTTAGFSHRRKGEPVIALAAIGLAWIGVRALAWQAPFAAEQPQEVASRLAPAVRGVDARRASPVRIAQVTAAAGASQRRGRAKGTIEIAPVAISKVAGRNRPSPGPRLAAPTRAGPAGSDTASPQPGPSFAAGPATIAQPPAPATQWDRPVSNPKAWRVDSWLAWRAGSGRALTAPGQPLVSMYGASQAGLLARLDLSPGARRPQAYVRLLHAPDAPRQSEIALGLSARPLDRLPVRLQAETRATRSQGATRVRPALLAVTELAPIDLPLGLRGEAYAQAGWVGGRSPTGFADGQMRLDREVVAAGSARVRLGAGAWGGVQTGAGRLDVGPTASFDLRGSAVPARVSLDYRRRVAGNAAPGSGLAVTLSTGF